MDFMGFPVRFCAYPFFRGQLTLSRKTLVSHRCDGEVEVDPEPDSASPSLRGL